MKLIEKIRLKMAGSDKKDIDFVTRFASQVKKLDPESFEQMDCRKTNGDIFICKKTATHPLEATK